MMEFITNFHFLRPWVLLFLIVPFFFYFKKNLIGKSISSWENICDYHLLEFLRIDVGKKNKISIQKYIFIGLVSAVIGAAGPAWRKIEIPTFKIENPSMFVLSLAKDMQLTDISPSRLERSKFMISDITDSLSDGQFGLEVYSQEPYVITPLTDDIKIIKSLLAQITPDIVPDSGDRLDRAIDLAVQKFQAAGYSSGNIIVFAADVGQRLDFAIEKIEKARNYNYTVNIVDTSYSGNDKLQLLAQKGNGVYMSVRDTSSQKILNQIQKVNDEKLQLCQNLRSSYMDYGYYLVFVCLLCLMPFFRKGLFVLLLFFMFSYPAQASFFLNSNQEGLQLFNSEQYETALKKFTDPVWRGVSLYKMEKPDEALKEFLLSKSAVSYYNAGVILTKQCHYAEALEAFKYSLELNPQDEDTLFNIKQIEDLLERAKEDESLLNCDNEQQQQQNQQQDQNNDDNQEENNENNNDNSQNDQENSQEQQEENSKDNQNQNQPEENNQQEQQSEQNQNNEQQQQKNEESQKNGSSSEDNQSQNNEDSSQPDSQKQNEDSSDKQNTPAKADNDSGPESKTKNNEGDDNNGSEEQQEEVEAQPMNAKKGDENTDYDEEALAIQRRYREIPEDVGGLLREFIKKEYMKDRYHDENM